MAPGFSRGGGCVHVLPRPLVVAGLAVELLFSLSKARLQISIPPPPRLQIHRLPHTHTHTHAGRAQIGSVIDRGDTEYKEAIREIVMTEEERRRRKADAGDSGCFWREGGGPERAS